MRVKERLDQSIIIIGLVDKLEMARKTRHQWIWNCKRQTMNSIRMTLINVDEKLLKSQIMVIGASVLQKLQIRHKVWWKIKKQKKKKSPICTPQVKEKTGHANSFQENLK